VAFRQAVSGAIVIMPILLVLPLADTKNPESVGKITK